MISEPDFIPREKHSAISDGLASAVLSCVGSADDAADILLAAAALALARQRNSSGIISELRRMVEILAAGTVVEPTGAVQ